MAECKTCEHREILTIETFWKCLHCGLVIYGWKGEKVEPRILH